MDAEFTRIVESFKFSGVLPTPGLVKCIVLPLLRQAWEKELSLDGGELQVDQHIVKGKVKGYIATGHVNFNTIQYQVRIEVSKLSRYDTVKEVCVPIIPPHEEVLPRYFSEGTTSYFIGKILQCDQL